ncbi:hypothetical protein POM88_041850 [Heracleum sosnowskyi]|uniref:Replication factor A C-terminal domain-containing protein n=1 Tax=Heracleum sosnowskyi TaxID=360622 RepID=A0AAD8MB53_9APIA|nr:hypothetical protein POM88_041850 [Heracleum sosnowskyi]
MSYETKAMISTKWLYINRTVDILHREIKKSKPKTPRSFLTMSFNKYDSLTALNDSKFYWNIRVRTQAVWSGITRHTQELKGMNIILVDDSNTRIHAFISAANVENLKEEIVEGKIYTISNFSVKDYAGDETNRAIRNPKHIYFSSHTVIKRDLSPGLPISELSVDLFDLESLEKMTADNRFLTDVVGILQDVQERQVYKNDNVEKSLIKFKITNGRTVIGVTLFGELGNWFEQAYNAYAAGSPSVIVVLTSAKANKYDNNTTLTNFPATRFYLNADHDSVNELRQRAQDPIFFTQEMAMEEEDIIQIFTVAQIKQLNDQYIEQKVMCEVTVKKVDDKSKWFYNNCTTCTQEVNKVEGRYKCSVCNRGIPYPDKRYMLTTLCFDESGGIAIIVPDRPVRKIIGKSVFEVLMDADDEFEDEAPLPIILKVLEKKKYAVTLLITQDNIKNGSQVYNAVDISNALEVSGTNTPGKTDNGDETSIIKESNGKDIMYPNDTPATTKSSMKTKARKTSDINDKSDLQRDEDKEPTFCCLLIKLAFKFFKPSVSYYMECVFIDLNVMNKRTTFCLT